MCSGPRRRQVPSPASPAEGVPGSRASIGSTCGQCVSQLCTQTPRVSQPARPTLWEPRIQGRSVPATARAPGTHSRSSTGVFFACSVFILSCAWWNFPEVTQHVIAQQIDCRIRFEYSFLPKHIFVWSPIFFIYFYQNNILQQIECRRYKNPAVC